MNIRLPNGDVVTYPKANFLKHGTHAWHLYTANPTDGGEWVCTLSPHSGCIVEAQRGFTDAFWLIFNNLRELRSWQLRKLKAALTQFDARSEWWKD